MSLHFSDRPIYRPDQDLLGRAAFAVELAKSIDQLSVASEGFVFAVRGEWGSGKTSIVELLLRHLQHLEMSRMSQRKLIGDAAPVPCSVAELENMAVIFERVRDQIELLDENVNLTLTQKYYRLSLFQSWLRSDRDAQACDQYWRLKVATDSSPRTIVVRFSPWLFAGRAELAVALLGELARVLGQTLGEETRRAFAALLTRLTELAPLAGAGLDAIAPSGVGSLLSGAAYLSSAFAEKMTSGVSLDHLRQQLKRHLRNLSDQRILVVIDDLDRLSSREALEMVSLIKSLCDLPNTIYLLSYDDEHLSSLISRATSLPGADYLKKIVQYHVDMPPVDEGDLRNLLNSAMISIVSDIDSNDQYRIGVAWLFVLRFYLQTPRDVGQFVNAITMAISSAGGHMDIADRMVLEALRIHEKGVYDWVRSNLSEVVS